MCNQGHEQVEEDLDDADNIVGDLTTNSAVR
jgi:hypothetical protein